MTSDIVQSTEGEDHTRIVIAIPTYNEALVIEGLLTKLAVERVRLPNLEIVVADGRSTDETRAIVSRVAASVPFIHLIGNPERIQSCGVNAVARAWGDRADVLIRCDAHAEYPSEFSWKLVKSLEAIGSDSIVIPMDSVGTNCFGRAVAWVSDSRIGSGGSAHRGGTKSGFVDHGHHAAFKLASFLQLGGYDETFTHNEDAEFDCRLNALQGKIYLDSSIRIAYTPRNSPLSLARQYYAYGAGRSRTIRRHPSTMRLRQIAVPLNLVLLVVSIFAFVATGSMLFFAWPAFYFVVLLFSAASIAAKHKSACGLLSLPAAAIMHLSWATGFFLGFLLKRENRWVLPLKTRSG